MPERLHVSKYNCPTERSCDVTDGTPWSFPLSKSIQYITSIPNGNPTGIYYYSDKWLSLCYKNHSLVTSCDNIFASKNRQCCIHLCSKGSQMCTFPIQLEGCMCGGVVCVLCGCGVWCVGVGCVCMFFSLIQNLLS